jgi:integrase
MKKLTNTEVAALKTPGAHGIGGGLLLKVESAAGGGVRKSWLFRFKLSGRPERRMGLGAYPDVSLKEAREQAHECRKLVAAGIDPIQHRDAERAKTAALSRTFREVAEAYFEHRRGTWTEKFGISIAKSFEKHVYPEIGQLRVGAVDTDAVMKVLKPRWRKIPVLANELCRFMRKTLEYAVANGWMERGFNPATWKAHLEFSLTDISRFHYVTHHPQLHWQEIGAFMQDLRTRGEVFLASKSNPSLHAVCAKVLEFQILTAVRPGEAQNAEWSEIDFDQKVWIIPKDRMKARRTQWVPLSNAAIAVLRKQEGIHPTFVFPGIGNRRAINACTVQKFMKSLGRTDAAGISAALHGFRGTFTTWAYDYMNFDKELTERSVAHKQEDATEEAYYQGNNKLEHRRPLMEAWGQFCDKPWQPAEVIQLPIRRASG